MARTSDKPKRGFGWESLFRSSPDPLFFLNNQRRIRYVNPAWVALTTVEEEEAVGLTCRSTGKPGLDFLDRVGVALAPPEELPERASRRFRRSNPLSVDKPDQPRWWDVVFFPIQLDEERDGLIGRIDVVEEDRSFAQQPLPENLVAIRERFVARFPWESVDGHSSSRRMHEQMRLAATTSVPVTILGEPGSGKSHVARLIHLASDKRDEAFVSVDCARLPTAFVEQLLFSDRCRPHLGHGTLLLKEPAALPREQQHRLGQWLDTKGSLRVIASMCVGPDQDERLLPEFYDVLTPLTIELPALKSRRADIEPLCKRLLDRARHAVDGSKVESVSVEAMDLLGRYAWPGNLTELLSVLQAACQRAKGEQLQPDDLPFYLRAERVAERDDLPLDVLLEKVERRLITLALERSKNNKTRAAEMLSIWRPRLLRRMEALGIDASTDDSEQKSP